MNKIFPVLFAQKNARLGDLAGNFAQVKKTLSEASKDELTIFPELFLTGAPLLDLIKRPSLIAQLDYYFNKLAKLSVRHSFLIGAPYFNEGYWYNALLYFSQGKLQNTYFKQQLSSRGAFNEPLYYKAGNRSVVIEFQGYHFGLLLGEDYQSQAVMQGYLERTVDAYVVCQQQVYEIGELQARLQTLQEQARHFKCDFLCINAVGGEGEIVYPGSSLYVNATQESAIQLAHCEEVIWGPRHSLGQQVQLIFNEEYSNSEQYSPEQLKTIYQVLVLSLRDYVEKNGFPGVVLGLSGGIDSALVLAIAVDALGAERVQAIMMPYKYTAEISLKDAKAQAELLGCAYQVISIAPLVEVFHQEIASFLEEKSFPGDTTEQNIQARSRGMILMSVSNRTGRLLLTTSNKSELAVGFCTLYGDMCGGFAPIKDVPKTLVYALSRYRNSLGACIPERVIERPPTAELAPDQLDLDNLPDYTTLDGIIEGYIEKNLKVQDLVMQGYDQTVVEKIIRLIERSEYKRQQSATGPKITSCNFHSDRRIPVSHNYQETLLS